MAARPTVPAGGEPEPEPEPAGATVADPVAAPDPAVEPPAPPPPVTPREVHLLRVEGAKARCEAWQLGPAGDQGEIALRRTIAEGAELVIELAPTGELVSFGREVRGPDLQSGEWTQCSRAKPVLFDDAAGCEAARKEERAVAVDLVGCEISAWPYEQAARDDTLAAFAARLRKGGALWAIDGDRCQKWTVADGREADGVVSSGLSIRRRDDGAVVETAWGLAYDPARRTMDVTGPSTTRTEGDHTSVRALGCYDTVDVRTRAPREISLGATYYLDRKRCDAALAHQRALDRWTGREGPDWLAVGGGAGPGGC